MDIEIRDTITLDDKKNYLVAGKAKYDNTDYLFLIETEEYVLKFAALAKTQVILLDNKSDKSLIEKLFPLFVENIQNEYTKMMKEENNQ